MRRLLQLLPELPPDGRTASAERLLGSVAQDLPPAARARLAGQVLDLQFEGTSEILERSGGDVRVLARAEHADRAGQTFYRLSSS